MSCACQKQEVACVRGASAFGSVFARHYDEWSAGSQVLGPALGAAYLFTSARAVAAIQLQ